MKKNIRIALVVVALALLSACAEKEQFKQAVLEQLKDDQDVKDYKINPEQMADCVVEGTSRYMPGAFPADPERKKAYIAYTKMLMMTKSKNPQQVMDELRKEFGSAQELASAHSNYTDSILNCQTVLITQAEEKINAAEETENKPKATAPIIDAQTSVKNEVQADIAPDPKLNSPQTSDGVKVVEKMQTPPAK